MTRRGNRQRTSLVPSRRLAAATPLAFVAAVGCATNASPPSTPGAPARAEAEQTTTGGPSRPAPAPGGADTVGLVPAGYGTLRQSDLSLRVQRFGLQVQATPLDESVIRLLSPDSYRALAGIKRSKSDAIAAVARRTAARTLSLWYVSFFTVEQGDTRFSPRDFVVANVGRDFRPIDVIPLTPGFGEQRLRQNQTQSALYVFDGQIDLAQPLTITYETARNDEWASLLQQIERERALVRSRAAARRSP